MRSIIQHLRFPFSYLLLPVFLMSSFHSGGDILSFKSILLFIILHILVYPSSNGYNSIQDRDTDSIGLIKNPLVADKRLSTITTFMDILAILLSALISFNTVLFILIYIIFSRLYSYRKIRLKQYPIIGFLVVFIFQGFWIYTTVYYSNSTILTRLPLVAFVIYSLTASFLIGSIYPLSQIYQHKQDLADGVKTISYLLGKKGTFIFSGIMFLIGSILLNSPLYYFVGFKPILIYIAFQLPSLIYFNYWFYQVTKDENEANFKHTMRMSLVSATCMNAYFIFLIFS